MAQGDSLESWQKRTLSCLPKWLKCMCMCMYNIVYHFCVCREASRVVLIPFKDPDPASMHIVDDSDLIESQSKAGSAICLFIQLGKVFRECAMFRSDLDAELMEIFSRCDVPVDSRVR